jgi:hypothetical protein
MRGAATLHDTLREVLLATDEADAAQWVEVQRAVRRVPTVVHLVEDDCSTDEALAYARTLWELGRDDETDEVLEAVIDAAFGGVDGPTSGRWPQGTRPLGGQGGFVGPGGRRLAQG